MATLMEIADAAKINLAIKIFANEEMFIVGIVDQTNLKDFDLTTMQQIKEEQVLKVNLECLHPAIWLMYS